jgi:hypothetical protein
MSGSGRCGISRLVDGVSGLLSSPPTAVGAALSLHASLDAWASSRGCTRGCVEGSRVLDGVVPELELEGTLETRFHRPHSYNNVPHG